MKTKKKLLFNIISIVLTSLCLLTLTVFSYFIFKINIIPTKYLLVGYGLSILIIILLLFGIFGKHKKVIKIISLFIIIVLSLGFSYITYYLNNTYNFLSNTQNNYEVLTYKVVVLNDTSYDNISSLKNKTISYLDDNNKHNIKIKLTSKIIYNEKLVTEFGKLPDLLISKETEAICIEESYLALIYEEIENFEEDTKIIYTFKVIAKTHKEESNISITEDPFILYISGIDQFGNVNSVRGRSDVNILAVINPKTNHILLVNTPRDYYVRLAGTNGLKDKLTHAGIYGINKSIDTLENLYSININHYLRVNFNTLIKAVDVIGGIDIYSDKAFVPWTNKKLYINYGWNHMDGKTALAYARERKTYTTGDNHRGENQQQVITAIIDKVSKSSVLISKYNSILNTLNGSFQTDMDTSLITSFIRYQIDKMPTWTIESIAVSGSGSYNYTYSMGTNYKLYVMEPDYNSIATAKKRIDEVLKEN